MAKITRQTQKLFGSSAGANQIAQFGSLNNGTPTFTTSIATIQALSNYLVGWYNAVIGGNSPAIEDMNALCYLFSYQIGYVLQEGVPEWDSGTTYYTGSIVNDGTGNLYVSIQDSNVNHAVTDNTWWRISSPSGLAQYCMFVGDANGAAQPANTSLIGDISAQYVSQTYAVTSAAPGVFTVAVSPLTGQTAYVTVTQNGFTANVRYYVTKVSGTTFKLATTLANALAGTNITSSGTVAGVIISGGMGVATGSLANPMTLLGDLFYGGSTPVAGTPTRLAGDTSDTRKFLRALSVAGTAQAPAWDTLVQGDLPALAQYNMNIGNSSGIAQVANTNLLGDVKGQINSQTATVTIATPGVFTSNSHGMNNGDKFFLTTTGALPTGLAASTTYYAANVSTNSFSASTSITNALAGTYITTSGSQSGVHTLYTGGLKMNLSRAPTLQKFTSGSGTYTTPSTPAPLYLRVKMVGGGGGGGGSGSAAGGNGGTGGNTTFGTSLLTANGGAGGIFNTSASSAGGTASVASPAYGFAITGAGSGSSCYVNPASGSAGALASDGGSSPFGGAGRAGGGSDALGSAAQTNSGSGGGGGGSSNPGGGVVQGQGGSAGGYLEATIPLPSGTYSYAVGAAGTAGTTGTSGHVGYAGGSGLIIVEEYYQ